MAYNAALNGNDQLVIIERSEQPTGNCPIWMPCYMQHKLTQTLLDFVTAVIREPNSEFWATYKRSNWNNSVATFEKGIKGNAY